MLPLTGRLKLISPPVRLMAPRLRVALPPLPATTPMVLLLAVTFRPLKFWVLASPAAQTTLSVPPVMLSVEAPAMMSLVGPPAVLKSRRSVPPPTVVAPA